MGEKKGLNGKFAAVDKCALLDVVGKIQAMISPIL